MSEINHRYIQTNGIKMHVAEAGQGFPVVLCHGFPEMWYSWRHQMKALAESGFRAIAPDQRGYGDTECPQPIEAYTQKQIVTDLIGMLDALGIEVLRLVRVAIGPLALGDLPKGSYRELAAKEKQALDLAIGKGSAQTRARRR